MALNADEINYFFLLEMRLSLFEATFSLRQTIEIYVPFLLEFSELCFQVTTMIFQVECWKSYSLFLSQACCKIRF